MRKLHPSASIPIKALNTHSAAFSLYGNRDRSNSCFHAPLKRFQRGLRPFFHQLTGKGGIILDSIVFYTPAQIAEMLQVSYDTALSWIKTSGIVYYQVGKQYRVTKASFDQMFTAPAEPVRQKLRTRPIYVIERK